VVAVLQYLFFVRYCVASSRHHGFFPALLAPVGAGHLCWWIFRILQRSFQLEARKFRSGTFASGFGCRARSSCTPPGLQVFSQLVRWSSPASSSPLLVCGSLFDCLQAPCKGWSHYHYHHPELALCDLPPCFGVGSALQLCCGGPSLSSLFPSSTDDSVPKHKTVTSFGLSSPAGCQGFGRRPSVRSCAAQTCQWIVFLMALWRPLITERFLRPGAPLEEQQSHYWLHREISRKFQYRKCHLVALQVTAAQTRCFRRFWPYCHYKAEPGCWGLTSSTLSPPSPSFQVEVLVTAVQEQAWLLEPGGDWLALGSQQLQTLGWGSAISLFLAVEALCESPRFRWRMTNLLNLLTNSLAFAAIWASRLAKLPYFALLGDLRSIFAEG